jgi:aspartyl-tRNA(Asn)/glutamyl-tRNA(Gln) amidotransferase subunit A
MRSELEMDDLAFLSIQDAATLVKSKAVSPVELARACLLRIEALNPSLHAFITVTADTALDEARRAQSEVQRGLWRGPLHGIPVALKDSIDTAGVRTTGGSALFQHRVPREDAAVVERLKNAGAVLLGKLNMQEFAYGGTSVPSHFGPVSNPWDLQCIAGGSSGGSAAAVAAGLCYASLGTDTGGSIREPAAFCGVVGLKPTYGAVSNRGVIPLSWSLDHVGPITRTVADAATVLQAIAGYDPCDMTSQAQPAQGYRESISRSRRLRIGMPRDFFYADLHAEVHASIEEALSLLVEPGTEATDVPLEVSTDRTVFRAEAFAYHAAHLARTPELYLPETLAKLRMGAGIDAASYIRARRDLEQLRRNMSTLFASVDFLVTPTTPIPAPQIAHYPASLGGVLALEAGSVLRNTRPFNMFGIPTITIPCGITQAGLPIGLQIAGPPWAEQRVLQLAQAFESATRWHKRRPSLSDLQA